MIREYHAWHSPNLGREMELLAFGHAGLRVVVFPTRSGRFYDFENWRLLQSIRHHVEQGWLQIYCVDSIDGESLYHTTACPRERIARHELYERYLIDEVLPFSLERNSGSPAMTLGCSLGAYHAMNLGLRNPTHFARILSIGGRFTLAQPMPGYSDLFNGYYDDRIAAHMPAHYLPVMEEGGQLEAIRRLDIRMIIGRDDPFLGSNQHLHREFHIKDVPARLIEWDGHGHSGYYWRRMLPLYV